LELAATEDNQEDCRSAAIGEIPALIAAAPFRHSRAWLPREESRIRDPVCRKAARRENDTEKAAA